MTRFNMFTDEELDAMESAFCNEGLIYLVDEIRRERRYRESRKWGIKDGADNKRFTILFPFGGILLYAFSKKYHYTKLNDSYL